jgi:hypothetical protein
VALGLVLTCASVVAQSQHWVKIVPLGNKVHLILETGSPQREYVLESQDKLGSVAYRGPVEEAIDTGVGMFRSQPFFTAAAELVLNKPISVSKLATVGASTGLCSLRL